MSVLQGKNGGDIPADRTMEILRRHLDNDYSAAAMAPAPVSRQQVQALAREIGVELPEDVQAHLSGDFPGVFVEAKEDIWPRPTPLSVGPFWSFCFGFFTYTASTDSEDWMRAACQADDMLEITGEPLFPLLKIIGDQDIYCIDRLGRIVRFDHELGEVNPTDLDFYGLLEQQTIALKQRTEQMKAEQTRH